MAESDKRDESPRRDPRGPWAASLPSHHLPAVVEALVPVAGAESLLVATGRQLRGRAVQLPLDLCWRRGVQDNCNKNKEYTGSPARERATGDVTPRSIPMSVLRLGIRCRVLLLEHQGTKPWQDDAPADPDVPADRAGVSGLTSAGEGIAPRAGTVPPAQDMAYGGRVVPCWDPRGEQHSAQGGCKSGTGSSTTATDETRPGQAKSCSVRGDEPGHHRQRLPP